MHIPVIYLLSAVLLVSYSAANNSDGGNNNNNNNGNYYDPRCPPVAGTILMTDDRNGGGEGMLPAEEVAATTGNDNRRHAQREFLPMELFLLPRLLAAAAAATGGHRQHARRFSPVTRNELTWLGEGRAGGFMDRDYESEQQQQQMDNEIYSTSNINESKRQQKKPNRTPVLSISAPMETLRQRIQWELNKKQLLRNEALIQEMQENSFSKGQKMN